MDLTYINIQTLQSILDQLYPGAKAYGEPGGDLRAALCGNDIVTIRRGPVSYTHLTLPTNREV